MRKLAPLAGYVTVSFLYFGLPVAAHPARLIIGSGSDPDLFVWSFAWWPHALLHGQNPFVSHAIWAPSGIDLAWATTVPGLSFAFAPLTLIAGPVVAYNVAAILLPALAAWTAFLLCRRLTGAIWPALVGGYLFGFSSYTLGQEQGHLHVSSVFLVPLIALVLLRYFEGELTPRGLALRAGLLLGAQLSFSTELFFTVTLALGAALVIAYASLPERRRAIVGLRNPLAAAYALGVALNGPLLYYALSDFQSGSVNPPDPFVADLLNIVVPTRLIELGGGAASGISQHFLGNDAELGAYLGLPTLVIVALFLRRHGRFLPISLAIALLASFGAALHVYGKRLFPLPWRLVSDLPLFDNVLTVRFSLFSSLAAAVIVALWAAGTRSWLGIALPVLAVLALVPQLRNNLWKVTPDRPTFFTSGADRRDLRPGENVLILPYGPRTESMLWQAEAHFRFRIAGGYVSPDVPPGFDAKYSETIVKLLANEPPPGGGAELLRFARAKGVTTILVEAKNAEPWRSLLRGLAQPRDVGGMLVYPLAPGAEPAQP